MRAIQFYASFFVCASMIVLLNHVTLYWIVINYFRLPAENVYMAVVLSLSCVGVFYLALEVTALKLKAKFYSSGKLGIGNPILMFGCSIVFSIPMSYAAVYSSISETILCFDDAGFSEYQYFSFTTFSTLGYGDVAPIGICRYVAVTEAMLGLITLPFLVALGMRHLPRVPE